MIVLDASLVVGWILFEEEAADNEYIFRRVAAEGAISPAIFEIEVMNAFRNNLKRRKISLAQRDEALRLFLRVNQRVLPPHEQPALAEIITLSDRHDLTAYDASYVALALRHGALIATRDQAMARAARAEGLVVLA